MTVSSMASVPETGYGHIEMKENRNDALTTSEASATEMAVREYFKDIPVLVSIARCESRFRHMLADGSVLHGEKDPADTGVMQINTRYHSVRAVKLGLDLRDLHDNMVYARLLYETEGTTPWNASAGCWNHTLAKL